MISASTDWVVRLDGHIHAVKAANSISGFKVYVDGELAWKTWLLHALYPRELCRFQQTGHEYILLMKGRGLGCSLELRVDGLVVEPTNDGPLAAPTSGAKATVPQNSREQRIELVETQAMEESLGEERRVIDNSASSAEVKRTFTVSKEWSQTIAINNETTTSVKGEVSTKLNLIVNLNLKLEAERKIREKY